MKIKFGIVAVLALLPMTASAAGVTISPAFRDVSLAEVSPGADISITLTNQSSGGQTFRLTTADFGTLNESGGVAFLGSPASELEHRYGLVSWMKLEREQVFIPAAGSVKVAIHIDNRASLAPGGHYGAILATSVADNGEPQKDARVNVRQVIASLILVRKEGGAEVGLIVSSLKPQHNSWIQLTPEAMLRFQNPGNVHVYPRGILELTDPTGLAVASGTINEDSAAVFPESFRQIPVSLRHLRTAWMPGKYVLTAKYRYDGSSDIRTFSVTTWYIGTAILWLGALLVICASSVFLYRFIRKRRTHK